MSIYRRFSTDGFPSMVTTKIAVHKALFASEMGAKAFMEVVDEVRQETSFRLLAFVVMPDHVHMILIPSPTCALGKVMQLIKGRFSRKYNGMTGQSGRLWQSRYHERALRSEGELMAAIEYVHRNPVTAGLVKDVSAFAWSSANSENETDLEAYLCQAEV